MLRIAIWSGVIALGLAVGLPCWAQGKPSEEKSSEEYSKNVISGHSDVIHGVERKGVDRDLAERLFHQASGHDVIVTPDQLRGLRIHPPQFGLLVVEENEEP